MSQTAWSKKALMGHINPFVTNVILDPYYLGESTVIYRGTESDISFFFNFSMKFV